jgi:helix-turn-helix protein
MIRVELDYEKLAAALADHMPQANPWLTVAEAAEHIGASQRWLRGRLFDVPHSRVDGRIFLNRSELDKWLLAQSG